MRGLIGSCRVPPTWVRARELQTATPSAPHFLEARQRRHFSTNAHMRRLLTYDAHMKLRSPPPRAASSPVTAKFSSFVPVRPLEAKGVRGFFRATGLLREEAGGL
eukprot:5860287-Prymnesium_polylepis.1